jgi:hypothetical protein
MDPDPVVKGFFKLKLSNYRPDLKVIVEGFFENKGADQIGASQPTQQL